jgi:hypothetical protein
MPTRFKTGEPVRDAPRHDFWGLPDDVDLDAARPCIAVVTRVGPSVHWGPFASLADLGRWADANDLRVGVIVLTDPASDPSTWWYP